jgi:hypothetical protein
MEYLIRDVNYAASILGIPFKEPRTEIKLTDYTDSHRFKDETDAKISVICVISGPFLCLICLSCRQRRIAGLPLCAPSAPWRFFLSCSGGS